MASSQTRFEAKGAAGEGTSSQANLENGHGGEESNLDNPISSRPNSPAMSDNMSFADGSVSDLVMVSSSGDITLRAGSETRPTGPFNWIFYGF